MARSKHDWRLEFRRRRSLVAEGDWRELSQAVCGLLRDLPEIRAAETVHAFWPSLHEPEIDLRPLLHEMRDLGVRIALPVVLDFRRDRPRGTGLAHREWDPNGTLTVNRWGLSEPLDGRKIDPMTIDVVLVPGLGIDRSGIRIGHGFGYYDSWLNSTPARRIGVFPSACVVPRLPRDAHDIPLDVVVTERGIIGTSPSAKGTRT